MRNAGIAATNEEKIVNSDLETTDRHTSSKGEIVLYSRDVFFGMRVRTIVTQLDYSISMHKDARSFVEYLTDGTAHTVLALIDFNQPVDWADLATVISSEVPVVGFGSHTDVEGFRQAKQAGVARVVSNGEFSRSLPDLIAKYRRP